MSNLSVSHPKCKKSPARHGPSVGALVDFLTSMLIRMAPRHPARPHLVKARRALVRERRRITRLGRRTAVAPDHSERRSRSEGLGDLAYENRKGQVS